MNEKKKRNSTRCLDNDLYCGTSEGTVLHYSLQDNNTSAEKVKRKKERKIKKGK